MKRIRTLALSLAAVACGSGISSAAMTITFDEVGADVVATYSGGVNLGSLISSSETSLPAFHDYDGDEAYFRNYGTTGSTTITLGETSFIASPSFVTGSGGTVQTASSFSGTDFAIVADGVFQQIILPAGYASDSPINGSMTFAGTDIAALGLNPGTYLWTWGDGGTTDSATFTVIPEPSAIGLAGLGLMCLFSRRRR